MKTLLKITAIVISVFYVSCTDNEDIWVNTELPQETDVSLLDIWAYDVPLKVQSNGEWKIETEGDWFYVFPSSGNGDATVKICILENDTEERQTGRIVFITTNSSVVKTFEIGQKSINDYPLTGIQDDFNQKRYAVGYGYDIRKEYASPGSVTKQIIRWIEMDDENLIAINAPTSSFFEKTITGSSLKELVQNLSARMNVKTKFWGFKGEIDAAFKGSTNDTGYNEYAISYVEYKVTDIVLDTDIEDIKENWLTAAAKKAINGTSATYQGTNGIKLLFDNYGTHLITKADLGGRLRYNMSVDVSKVSGYYDINTYIKASYSKAFVRAGTTVDSEISKSYENNKEHITLSFNASGGDTSPLTIQSDDKAVDTWKKSVEKGYDKAATNRTALIGFGQDLEGLIPIYELADDPARRDEIKAVMENKGFVSVDYEDKNCYHINAPTFSDSLSASLVKEVKDNSDRVVAVVCNEFIPEISPSKRVDVIYPVASGKILMHAGFFCGYEGRRPARISWSGSNLKIVDYDEFQEKRYDDIYLSGSSVKSKTEDDSKQTTCYDAYLNAVNYHQGGDYNYPLVKIFGNIWTREDYKSGKDAGGGDYKPFVIKNNPHTITVNIGSALACSYYPDMMYRRIMMLSQNDKNYSLEPSGWTIPTATHYKEIDAMLTKYGIHTGKSFRYNPSRPQTLGYDATSGYLKNKSYDGNGTSVLNYIPSNTENSYWTKEGGYVRINEAGFYVIEESANKDALYDHLPIRLIKKN